jgi:(p)ppGpp synthase/HD superfamily hydrolase
MLSEDTDVTKEEIEKEFGNEVAEMVNDVTEQDKSLPWAERKRHALEHIHKMNHGSLLVKSADQLHNMTDLIEDYKKEGDKMFEKFNATKEKQLERYKILVPTIEKTWPENPLLPDLKEALREIERLWK